MPTTQMYTHVNFCEIDAHLFWSILFKIDAYIWVNILRNRCAAKQTRIYFGQYFRIFG